MSSSSAETASEKEESPSPSASASVSNNTLVMRSKRKRTLTNGAGPSQSRLRTEEPEDDEEDEEEEEEEYGIEEDDNNNNTIGYDPDQPLDERRRVQRGYRELMRGLQENTDAISNPRSMFLYDTIKQANQYLNQVKQTGEATIDSKVLVSAAELSMKRTARLANGNIAQGVDVDEFVSKCVRYMRTGGGIEEDDGPGLTMTQQRRRQPRRAGGRGSDDEDSEDDEGDMMNWEHLGRFACLPNIRRPATPGFLLGPLSVEKKVRKIVKRSAPFRADELRETRPEVLNAADVERSEKNDLTAICAKILRRLQEIQDEAQTQVEAAFDKYGDEAAKKLMIKYGLRDTGGIDLFKFVVNPHSFGQTVENMFYVSFLIRDGAVLVEFDEFDLPSLQPTAPHDPDPSAAKTAKQRQQAVFSIDMLMWKEIIDAFDITEPIIEHRKEHVQKGPGARSWYS
ncbi:hypothetical protein GGS20DRAFT_43458 [Poronia punctata]|nr:hypothetical protein GGS20DRAFT_43458 [Poronia punctata]